MAGKQPAGVGFVLPEVDPLSGATVIPGKSAVVCMAGCGLLAYGPWESTDRIADDHTGRSVPKLGHQFDRVGRQVESHPELSRWAGHFVRQVVWPVDPGDLVADPDLAVALDGGRWHGAV
jgi:hypothetical protein